MVNKERTTGQEIPIEMKDNEMCKKMRRPKKFLLDLE